MKLFGEEMTIGPYFVVIQNFRSYHESQDNMFRGTS